MQLLVDYRGHGGQVVDDLQCAGGPIGPLDAFPSLGLSMRAIGRVLKRSAATISREIARNSGGNGYSCRYAQQRRMRRRRHARPLP